MRTLIKNTRIITAQPHPQKQSTCCIAIEDDTIQHIGQPDDSAVETFLRHNDVTELDLGGRPILPSFVDGHVHLLQFGISLSKIDVGHCRTVEEMRRAISAAARERPDAKRLLFHCWKQSITGINVTSAMLDDLDPRPIYIDSHDLHSAWCNSAALEELKLPTIDPPGGTIHRDANGVPTGFLEESAVISLVWPFLSNLMSHGEKLDRLRDAMGVYNRAGYTTVIDMAVTEDYWDLLCELYHANEMKIRFIAHFLILPTGSAEQDKAQVERVIEIHQKYNLSTTPDFRVAGIKIITDGVVDACTAAVSKHYLPTKEIVQPIWSRETLRPVLALADGANLQCALHAIGDEAVTVAIDSLESLGTSGRRHRIEHLELTKPEDARRLGQLGITASVQPVHLDPELNSIWPPLIGDGFCNRAFAYREFLEHGAKLAIGTDVPTAPHQPWNNLFNATTRKSYRNPSDKETLNEQFRLDLVDALAAANTGSAYSCFAEDMVGSIEPGKKADFIILENVGDWENDPASLLSCKVDTTWLGGRIVSGEKP